MLMDSLCGFHWLLLIHRWLHRKSRGGGTDGGGGQPEAVPQDCLHSDRPACFLPVKCPLLPFYQLLLPCAALCVGFCCLLVFGQFVLFLGFCYFSLVTCPVARGNKPITLNTLGVSTCKVLGYPADLG